MAVSVVGSAAPLEVDTSTAPVTSSGPFLSALITTWLMRSPFVGISLPIDHLPCCHLAMPRTFAGFRFGGAAEECDSGRARDLNTQVTMARWRELGKRG